MTRDDADRRILETVRRMEDRRAADDICDRMIGELATHGIKDVEILQRMAEAGLQRAEIGLSTAPRDCLRAVIALTASRLREEARLWAALAPAAKALRPKTKTRRAAKTRT